MSDSPELETAHNIIKLNRQVIENQKETISSLTNENNELKMIVELLTDELSEN